MMAVLKYVPKPNTRLGKQHRDLIRRHARWCKSDVQTQENNITISIGYGVPDEGEREELHMVVMIDDCSIFRHLIRRTSEIFRSSTQLNTKHTVKNKTSCTKIFYVQYSTFST